MFDLAIVGAGILGLAHAYITAERGKKVIVLERDARTNGASIRNFGFVTVTGQEAGDCYRLARRSRDVWAEVAEAAGIEILHQGLLVTARRPEAEAVIDEFLETSMGAKCMRLDGAQARERLPQLREGITAALHSPHELRVESDKALPRLADWLEVAHNVTFRWGCEVRAVQDAGIATSQGMIEARHTIVCPGDDFTGPFASRLAERGLSRCKLHMLRVQPATPFELGQAVMSDLGMARYCGYTGLRASRDLAARLDREQPEQRAHGIHLIVVQSADGSLVVGDSHHYHATPDPFQPAHIDDLILEEFDAVFDLPDRCVVDRWLGTYAYHPDQWLLRDSPAKNIRQVIVTAGCGASTAFGIAEETINDLFE